MTDQTTDQETGRTEAESATKPGADQTVAPDASTETNVTNESDQADAADQTEQADAAEEQADKSEQVDEADEVDESDQADQAADQQPAEEPAEAAGDGKADIGVTGLATMGRNLARNLARHGHTVAVHNRTKARTDALMAEHGDEGSFVACDETADLVAALRAPRTVIVMVKAGAPTDAVVDELAELMEPGDIIVDGGNAHYLDTRRRETALQAKGIHFVGTGISGGEEGALEGPSIMPGGSAEAYRTVGPMLESIAAQVDDVPCCVHVGPDGAGHFVKMVHNGIEYADMQLIAEAYDLMRSVLGRTPSQLAEIFDTWNSGDLESFLIEITAKVLGTRDPRTGHWFVDAIRDEAEQKGTGRWTVQAGLDLGTPVSGIAEAVFARALSGDVEQRSAARAALPGPETPPVIDDPDAFVDDVRQALYASKVVAYAQGFDMLRAGSKAYGWDLDLGALAMIWRGGCIIRARFLDRIREAYGREATATSNLSDAHSPASSEAASDGTSGSSDASGSSGSSEPVSLLVHPYFAHAVADAQQAWRRVVTTAAAAGVPVPGFAAALAYYDGLRRDRLPAALVQGLRDLFGAHTYRRVDVPGVYHLDWAHEHAQELVELQVSP